MSLVRQLEAYIAAMRARELASLTLKNQRSHLARFAAHLAASGIDDVAGITREQIESYLELLSWRPGRGGRPMKVETRNVRLSSIKSFCRWLVHSEQLAVDPAEKVAYGREPNALPRSILSVEAMAKLLAAPDAQSLLGVRDRLVLELLYSTALRVAELCGLDVDDVDTVLGLARVEHGKGDKARVVPAGKLACELVESYARQVRPKLLAAGGRKDEPALVLSRYGERLGTRGVAKIIARHTAAIGIEEHVTPHSFRHSCATHMLRGGASIRHLQEMLGHARVTSTEVYTRVTITELKEAHERFHPRAALDDADVRPPPRKPITPTRR